MMFGWMTRRRNRSVRPVFSPRRARLSVEVLEDRYCLNAPHVLLSSVQELANHQVKVSGTVMDDSAPSVTLNFGGVVSGQQTVNSNNSFTFTTTASGLGQITAQGTDTLNQVSNQATITFSSNAPTVGGLSYTWGANKQVTITGGIMDELPGGLTVTFAGAAVGQVTTNPDGSFSVTLTASQLGQVTVSTTDQWNQTSAAASIALTNSAPSIPTFMGIQGAGHSWTFAGKVNDEYAPGEVVSFSGLPELANLTATVQADGSFSLTVTLAAGESGNVNCAVTDWWNVTSTTASYFVALA